MEAVMSKLISCEFNMDTNCVELVYSSVTMVSIDTIVEKNDYVEEMYQSSELEWLIYNDPFAMLNWYWQEIYQNI